jgi:hypothetical protein
MQPPWPSSSLLASCPADSSSSGQHHASHFCYQEAFLHDSALSKLTTSNLAQLTFLTNSNFIHPQNNTTEEVTMPRGRAFKPQQYDGLEAKGLEPFQIRADGKLVEPVVSPS